MNIVAKNIEWGVRWGLAFAAVYSVWGGIVFLLGGPDKFADQGVTFAGVLAFYLFAGIGAGAVVGACRSLLRSRWGAAFVGVIAGIPASAAGALLVVKEPLWSGEHTFVVAAGAVVLGGFGGVVLREVMSD